MPEQLAFNMDCLEAMRQMQDKAFDLAVVDPPYGIGCLTMTYAKEHARTYGRMAAKRKDYRKQEQWDVAPSPEYFAQLFRVSKKQIIWGG